LAPELRTPGLELAAQELAALAQEAQELVAEPVEALAVGVEAVEEAAAAAVVATPEEAAEEAHSLSEPALLAQEVNLVVTSHLHSPWLLQLQFVIPA
jgi:hypothetical protein